MESEKKTNAKPICKPSGYVESVLEEGAAVLEDRAARGFVPDGRAVYSGLFRLEDPTSSEASAVDKQDSSATKRGRHSNPGRRDAIRRAILTHGDAWRDHLAEIFDELDRLKVPLGRFQNLKIDIGEGHGSIPSQWNDLDLAEGQQRRHLIDALRQYIKRRN
jgi:hypothetical protein